MDRKLDFVYPAIIDAFSGVAGNISVQLNYKGYTPLVIANHFLITYYHDSKCSGFNWRHYNDDYGHFTDMHELVQKKGIVKALVEVLNLGFYVHIVLDHYYIRAAQRYQKFHFFHDCATVLGYNTEKEIFYTADNFVSGKFQVLEIPYRDIEMAREGNEEKIVEKFYFNNDIYYKLTPNKLKSLVRGYLDGQYYEYDAEQDKILAAEQNHNELYGILIYEVLLKQALKMEEENYFFDVRSYHVMFNHMNIGVLLIQWLQDTYSELAETIKEKDYLKRYTELAYKMNQARNLFLKLAVKYTKSGRDRLLELVKSTKEEEAELLEELYQDLDVCINPMS